MIRSVFGLKAVTVNLTFNFLARYEDSGQYKAKASNEAGEAVSIATLHIFEPPTNVTDGCQISQDSVESTVRNFIREKKKSKRIKYKMQSDVRTHSNKVI